MLYGRGEEREKTEEMEDVLNAKTDANLQQSKPYVKGPLKINF